MNPKKPTGPVMDVQRPRPNAAPVTSSLDSSMPPADHIAVAAPEPGHVIGQTRPAASPPPPEPEKSRKGLIVGLITLAVVLFIGIGVGGFLWYKSRSKPAPAATTSETQADRVGVDEVDATLADIDKQLNTLDDANDITTSEIQDGPLGL